MKYKVGDNETIGKCVAVCKALNHPIPDFIMNKNK